jgi:hypothetical protein
MISGKIAEEDGASANICHLFFSVQIPANLTICGSQTHSGVHHIDKNDHLHIARNDHFYIDRNNHLK